MIDSLHHLFIKYNKKDTGEKEKLKIRNEITVSSLGFVKFVARKYNYLGKETVQDLETEGILGLIDAVDKFDYKKNVKFNTFSFFYIRQKILYFLNCNFNNIRYPPKVPKDKRKTTVSLTSFVDIIDKSDSSKIDAEITISFLFKKLNAVEKQIIIHRFGLFDTPAKTLRELEKILHLSYEAIRKKQKKAMQKLRSI